MADDPSGEQRNQGDADGVRIVTSEELLERERRRRDLPPPPVVESGPATTEHDLPHWTAPATGQVPAVVIGEGGDVDRSSMTDSPRWRSEHDADDHADQGDLFADLLAGEPERPVTERLGTPDAGVTDEEFLNFDDVDLDPRRRDRRSGRGGRSRRGVSPDDDALAAILPADLVGERPTGEVPAIVGRGAGAPTGPSSSGASSRNVPVAAAVGIGMAVGALALFKAGPVPALLLVTVILGLAGFEFFGALQRSGFRPATLLGLAAVVGLPLAGYWKGESAIPAIVFLVVVFGVIWFLTGHGTRGRPTANLGVTLLGVAWIGVLGSYAALLLAVPSQGVSILLLAVVATVASDVGGFFFGRSMGRSPLIATSPNKTVEGLLGGMATTVFVVFVFAVVLGVGPFGAGKALLLGIALAVVAPLGDLAESLFKRDLGLKDFGSILPQHGGILDRFDGMLFVLPATYYVARIVSLG